MKIALLGDTAFFGKNTTNNHGVFDYFKDIREKLKEYDDVVVNLETPFNIDSKPNGYKSAYISSTTSDIELLKYLGVTTVNLANNHLFDYGKKSYELTKQILSDNGFQYFGVEKKQVLIEKEGNKIAFSGYCCYSSNPLGLCDDGVNELFYPTVEKTLTDNSNNGYNNILSIHAGAEHINFPSFDHIKFARKLSGIVPYVYYGHHPHVLQGIEKYNESIIAYSLGNFCFDDIYTEKSKTPLVRQTENNKSSIILELEYQDNKLLRYNSIAIFAGDEKCKLVIKKLVRILKPILRN